MINRYCKFERFPIIPIVPDVLTTVFDDEGNPQTAVTKELLDPSVYGDYRDWSLQAMKDAGLDPKSFSSPAVVGSRISVASNVQNIDLTPLDVPTE